MTLTAASVLLLMGCDRSKGKDADSLMDAYHKLAPITLEARHASALEARALLVPHDDLDESALPPGPLLVFGPETKASITWPLRHIPQDTSPEATFSLVADRGALAAPIVLASGELMEERESQRATQHMVVKLEGGRMASLVLTSTPELAGCQSYDPASVRHQPPCEACQESAGEQGSPALSCQVATVHMVKGASGSLEHMVTLRPALQDTETGCIDRPARETFTALDDIDRVWREDGGGCARGDVASELLGRLSKRETLCDHVEISAGEGVEAQAMVDMIGQLVLDQPQFLYTVSLSAITESSLMARCGR